MMTAGLILWSAALVLLTWTLARRKPPEPRAIINAQADAVHERVAAQEQAVQEISDAVEHFSLSDYLNGRDG